MQIDYICTAQIAVEASVVFFRVVVSVYILFGHLCFTLLILQQIVSNYLFMTIITRIASLIKLYDLNILKISCDYALTYDGT